MLKTITNLLKLPQKRKNKERLDHILSQAECIIEASPVKNGRTHPIFAFVTSITNKIFYDNLFELNATYQREDIYDFNSDMQWMRTLNQDYDSTIGDFIEYNKGVKSPKPIPVYLKKDAICPNTWEPTRFVNTLSNIGTDVGEPFKCIQTNHRVGFIWPLGVINVKGGNHSISSGMIKGEGIVYINADEMEITDVSAYFENFYFDGTSFRRKKNNEEVYKPNYFESGVLYEVGRLIYENNIDYFD